MNEADDWKDMDWLSRIFVVWTIACCVAMPLMIAYGYWRTH